MTIDHIQAIIFDKDGTLIDFEGSWAEGMQNLLEGIVPQDLELRNKLADAAGFNIKTQTFQGGSVFVNGTTEDMIKHWQTVVPSLKTETFYKQSEIAFANLTPKPLCDLPELLGSLQVLGLKLGVVTNASEGSTVVQLEKMNCLHMFDRVIGCDSGFIPKPAGDTILGFCEHVGLRPSQVAMVGDSTHDLNAGRAAGVGLNVGVLSGPALRDEIEFLADVILDDVTHLPPLFRPSAI